jgi:hypothetical protein
MCLITERSDNRVSVGKVVNLNAGEHVVPSRYSLSVFLAKTADIGVRRS